MHVRAVAIGAWASGPPGGGALGTYNSRLGACQWVVEVGVVSPCGPRGLPNADRQVDSRTSAAVNR